MGVTEKEKGGGIGGLTFLDLFAGIGGFRRGLERSGHTCVGHVEIDMYANRSYMAMYELLPCKGKTKGEGNISWLCHRKGEDECGNQPREWFAKDIKQLTAGEIPTAEIWAFGFPCTDISVSGRMAGLHGTRSGLFFEVARLLKGTDAENKPQYLLIENVKHLLSCNGGRDFTTVLTELWEAGYGCEWCVVNSKDFGVPQHRERVYLVGYLGGGSGRKLFPVRRTDFAPVEGSTEGTWKGQSGCTSFVDMSRGARFTQQARSVMAKQNAGVTNHKGETSGVFFCKGHPDCAMAVLSPNRMEKRQNGRRIKGVGEPGFTLTCQDRHGILLGCFGEGKADALSCCRIRRLTPRECWRLQAFDDFLFDRAEAAGTSDTQLYKQAGNAVTVNIVYEIGKRLSEMEEDRKQLTACQEGRGIKTEI